MRRKPSSPFLLLASAALLTACGGGGGGSVIDIANGGIGGTGTGTVTGFGSIILNEIRRFDFGPQTQVSIDGEDASEDDLGVGMVVRVTIGDDAGSDFTRGTLVSVTADSLVKGPVTSLTPLRVLGQEIAVVTATVLDGVPGDDLAQVAVGDVLEVAGFRDREVIRATRLSLRSGGLPVWKLTGNVTSLVADTSLAIGTQIVLFNGVQPRDCSGGLALGDRVEVRAAAIEPFTAGDSLTSTLDIECLPAGLPLPENPVGSNLPASAEGFIETVTSTEAFTVNGQAVTVSQGAVFEGGSRADLVVGARVEAEGLLSTQTGVLQASRLRIREARVRLEAPLQPADILDGERLTLLGVTVNRLAGIDDDDGVFSGLDEATQVEVRGFVDANGAVYASEVRARGEPDASDTRLRGPLESAEPPLLTVLGVTIDTSEAILRGDDGSVVDADTFFAALTPGRPIQIQDADFDPASATLSGGEVSLED